MDIDAIRAVVESVEPRARVASAIANVCGVMTDRYVPMVNLMNDLKAHPDLAGMAAADQAASYPDGSLLRVREASQILAVLHGLDLGTPERERQVRSLRVYHDVLLGCLTGTSEEARWCPECGKDGITVRHGDRLPCPRAEPMA